MKNSVPYEVIAAPYTVYKAPVGTAFPAVNVAPGVGWTKIGTSGDLNYDEAVGVTVEHRQTVASWRSAGDTGPRKRFRQTEDLLVKMKLVDLTLEQYANALNDNVVTDTAAGAGTAGKRKIGLSRGTQIATFALLVRADISPYMEEGKMQYEIPRAQEGGNPTVALSKKGEPAGLDLEFSALVDPSAASEDERFGRLVVQDAAPTA